MHNLTPIWIIIWHLCPRWIWDAPQVAGRFPVFTDLAALVWAKRRGRFWPRSFLRSKVGAPLTFFPHRKDPHVLRIQRSSGSFSTTGPWQESLCCLLAGTNSWEGDASVKQLLPFLYRSFALSVNLMRSGRFRSQVGIDHRWSLNYTVDPKIKLDRICLHRYI